MGKTDTVHVFGIKPGTIGAEIGYAYPHWEPEPPESASDEEYDAWQERNPIWGLRRDLDCYLDEDFVEFFGKIDREFWEYLATYIASEEDINRVRQTLEACDDMVLVFESAFDGGEATMRSTEGAIYAGGFECKLGT